VSRNLVLQNRQKVCRVNLPFLRKIIDSTLGDLISANDVDLGIYLVAASEITILNETFLKHAGSTDVISFNYSESPHRASRSPALLHGEIFICVDEAVRQSKKFRTSWQNELTRYIVHGILHLLGYDYSNASQRRKMKREEDRVLRQLSRQFDLSKLALSRRKQGPKMTE